MSERSVICEKVAIENKSVLVIAIPPSPNLHETTRQFQTYTGEFDESGQLRFVRPDKLYSPQVVFIRRGEGIFPATHQERKAIEKDKAINSAVIQDNPLLADIVSVLNEVCECTNLILMENQKVIVHFLIHTKSRRDVADSLLEMYHMQNHRADYSKWQSYLEGVMDKITERQTKELLSKTIKSIENLRTSFYKSFLELPENPYDYGAHDFTKKRILSEVLYSERYTPSNVKLIAEGYLDYLRENLDVISSAAGALKSML